MNKKFNFEFLAGIFVLLISLLLLFLFLSKITLIKKNSNFELESSFFDIGNLQKGSNVKINGVNVGEVNKIFLDDETYMAIVKTSFYEYLDIPIDSSFIISSNGFMGSPYIEISLGTSTYFFKNLDSTQNNIDSISLEEIINNFIFK